MGEENFTLTENNAPTVTVETTEESPNTHFSWENPFVPGSPPNLTGSINWSNNGGLLSATTTVNGLQPQETNSMAELHLYFNSEPESQILIQNGSGSGEAKGTKDKVVIKGGTKATSIKVDFGGKGLSPKYKDDSKGSLHLNFGNSTSSGISNKTIHVTGLTT